MWHPSFPTEGLNRLGTEANRQRTEEQNASLLVAEVTLGGNAQWKSHDELASFSSLGLGGARLRENLDARKRHFSTPLLPTGPRGDGGVTKRRLSVASLDIAAIGSSSTHVARSASGGRNRLSTRQP